MVKRSDEYTWFREYCYDKFQRIKRKPDYIQVAEKYEFDPNGFESDNIIEDTKLAEKADSLKRKFGLNLLFDPSLEIPKERILEEYIFKDQFLVEFDLREYKANWFDPIWDPHHIKLKIDISLDANINQIISEIKECIEEAQELISASAKKKKRHHFDKREVYYQIWDMRKECKSFREIALRLNISEHVAEKRFKKAFELITGNKYEKEYWIKHLSNHFERIIKKDGAIDFKRIKNLSKKMEPSSIGVRSANVDLMKSLDSYNQVKKFILITDIEKICRNCQDSTCRDNMKKAMKREEFEHCNPCPKIIKYLTEN
jgi:hypothetical protein